MRKISLIFAGSAMFFVSCAHKDFDPDNPQSSFEVAKEPFEDERFEVALKKLGEFKARFPYSSLVPQAELLIADSHFNLGQYAEASVSYEQFTKLHPKDPEVPYALFRVGESYWRDAPEERDREQEYTNNAVREWSKLVDRFPGNDYSAKARDLIKVGRRRIAESEEFAAHFYCRQEIWHACVYRYLQLAEKYSSFLDLKKNSLMEASYALRQLAEQKTEENKDANLYFRSLTKDQMLEKAKNLEALAHALPAS